MSLRARDLPHPTGTKSLDIQDASAAPPNLFRSDPTSFLPKSTVEPMRPMGLSLLTLALVAAATWAFWPQLSELGERWFQDSQYSHGAIVPFVCAYILWARRRLSPSHRHPAALGLILVAAGLGFDAVGEATFVGFLRALGFLLVLMGIVASLLGWKTLGWALSAILLLAFAIPLPSRIHTALAEPLQKTVASGATSLLQLRGRPAVAMGHTVAVDEYSANVVDACSGAGMLFVVAFAAAVIAILSNRPLVDKVLLFVAAPIAGLLANVLRVAATLEVRCMGYGAETAKMVHDIGGHLVGPVALLMLLATLFFVAKAFPATANSDEHQQIAFQLGISDPGDHAAAFRRRSVQLEVPGS